MLRMQSLVSLATIDMGFNHHSRLTHNMHYRNWLVRCKQWCGSYCCSLIMENLSVHRTIRTLWCLASCIKIIKSKLIDLQTTESIPFVRIIMTKPQDSSSKASSSKCSSKDNRKAKDGDRKAKKEPQDEACICCCCVVMWDQRALIN